MHTHKMSFSVFRCWAASLATVMFLSACGAEGYVQNASSGQESSADGALGSSASNDLGSSSDPASPSTAQNPLSASLVQGGDGWKADINIASSSRDYLGLTLDQLMAGQSNLARALAKRPAVQSAIEQVSKETGVPAGLLAGLIYQESSFDPTAVSNNPNPTAEDPRDVGLTQAPEPDFRGKEWQDPYTNIHLFVTKYFLPTYESSKSWGYALRIWNSGIVLNKNNLSKENNHTDPNYITEILGTHCLGRD